MKNLLFIINPHSGRGELRKNLLDCLDIFCKAGYHTTVFVTQGPKDASIIVQKNASAYDRVICAGGDGTLDEVVNGLMLLEKRPEIGYIPCGTTNDFANSLGLPINVVAAAHVAAEGRPFPLDIGRFNDKYFCYIAAFGAFTGVSYTTSQTYKNLLGHAAYVLEGIRTLPFIKAFHVRVESAEMTVEDNFIYGMVSNATSVGGFIDVTAEQVEMDDGLFEVLLIRESESPTQLENIINLLWAQNINSDKLCHFKTRSVRFLVDSSANMQWTLDGEFGGSPNLVCIENEKQVIHMMVKK